MSGDRPKKVRHWYSEDGDVDDDDTDGDAARTGGGNSREYDDSADPQWLDDEYVAAATASSLHDVDADRRMAEQLQRELNPPQRPAPPPTAAGGAAGGGSSDSKKPTTSGAGGGGGGAGGAKKLSSAAGASGDGLTESARQFLAQNAEMELLDPHPDVRALMLQYDTAYFDGWLSQRGVEVAWSNRMTSCAGICSYDDAGFCSIRLSRKLLQFRSRKDLLETLLHEMVHAFLFVREHNTDHDAHGPTFLFHMHRINKLTGLDLGVYHTFHDEVAELQQHKWRCDGTCVNEPPYFGMVARASNRAPGPNDGWWEQHQATCGGTFIKFAAPPGYGEPNNKRKRAGNVSSVKLEKGGAAAAGGGSGAGGGGGGGAAKVTTPTPPAPTPDQLQFERYFRRNGSSSAAAATSSSAAAGTDSARDSKSSQTQPHSKRPRVVDGSAASAAATSNNSKRTPPPVPIASASAASASSGGGSGGAAGGGSISMTSDRSRALLAASIAAASQTKTAPGGGDRGGVRKPAVKSSSESVSSASSSASASAVRPNRSDLLSIRPQLSWSSSGSGSAKARPPKPPATLASVSSSSSAAAAAAGAIAVRRQPSTATSAAAAASGVEVVDLTI